MVAFNIDSIPDRDKAQNCWAVWKTEKESQKKVSYGMWITFYEAVLLLVRYPEFDGLSFISSHSFENSGLGYHNTDTKITVIEFYPIKNIREFLKIENPRIKRGCQ